MQLTSEGEDLLRRGRRLLAEAEAFAERASALKKGETVSCASAQRRKSSRARSRSKLCPGVEVRLVEAGGNDLPDRLDRGDILLALMAVDDAGFEARLLYPAYVHCSSGEFVAHDSAPFGEGLNHGLAVGRNEPVRTGLVAPESGRIMLNLSCVESDPQLTSVGASGVSDSRAHCRLQSRV